MATQTVPQNTDTPRCHVREAMLVILFAVGYDGRRQPIGIEQNGPDSDLLAIRFASYADMSTWLDFFDVSEWERATRYPGATWRGWHVQLGVHAAARQVDGDDVHDCHPEITPALLARADLHPLPERAPAPLPAGSHSPYVTEGPGAGDIPHLRTDGACTCPCAHCCAGKRCTCSDCNQKCRAGHVDPPELFGAAANYATAAALRAGMDPVDDHADRMLAALEAIPVVTVEIATNGGAA